MTFIQSYAYVGSNVGPMSPYICERLNFMRISGPNGAQGRSRTTDTAIFSRMLYQLSYLGVPAVAEAS
jgi:hypothetical protein